MSVSVRVLTIISVYCNETCSVSSGDVGQVPVVVLTRLYGLMLSNKVDRNKLLNVEVLHGTINVFTKTVPPQKKLLIMGTEGSVGDWPPVS